MLRGLHLCGVAFSDGINSTGSRYTGERHLDGLAEAGPFPPPPAPTDADECRLVSVGKFDARTKGHDHILGVVMPKDYKLTSSW
jgi:hypothetical protein